MNPHLNIRPDIAQALKENHPVVALESTIISHGMPYPDNIAMAKRVETIIESYGVIPATIAIINGVLKVGLTEEELTYLAKSKNVHKASKRDIAPLIAQKQTGATTVSATMLIAEMAGIEVFATGGIGGVHREASQTFDISRDLEELASCHVTVVCAGVKSILDLPLTLEYLETKGVEVIGYQTDELPAFYTRESGLKLETRLDTPQAIAAVIHTKRQLGLQGGLVITNPIPKAHAMDAKAINHTIEAALDKAKEEGVSGKDTTPYLLDAIKKMTKGKSLEANLSLVYNNAELAALIAVEYAKITSEG